MDDRPGRRRGGRSMRWWGHVGPDQSVRADGPEAVRAVDRSVHARLERHLRLVATGRADHGEVLAVGAVVATLVAARAADVVGVVAAITSGAPAGSAAGAALGVAGEPLLHVVLLIGGRVDELHPAIDTVKSPIDVGHERCSSGARAIAWCAAEGG